MATDGHTEDINIFLSSLGHCFEEADKALKDECNSVPLDYTESGLEDHLQIVNAIAIASLFQTYRRFLKACCMKSIPIRFRERQAVLSQQLGFLVKKQVPEEDLDTG